MAFSSVVCGDVVKMLREMEDGQVRCCVTSPPYWGLRDYGVVGQLGLEPTPEAYVANMVEVFRGVHRVLSDDGTLWLNLGDSYAGSGRGGNPDAGTKQGTNRGSQSVGVLYGRDRESADRERERIKEQTRQLKAAGIKPKDLVGIPWRIAFALQADGWYLRSDIIWHKTNPMPESVTDRPTRAHEYMFLLTKSDRYYYNAAAVAEPAVCNKTRGPARHRDEISTNGNSGLSRRTPTETRNRRSVWTIPTKPFKGAHFAVMPEALVEPCILAGSAKGDTVLDPFAGSGTVGVVALRHDRNFIGFDLNKEYVKMAKARIAGSQKEG